MKCSGAHVPTECSRAHVRVRAFRGGGKRIMGHPVALLTGFPEAIFSSDNIENVAWEKPVTIEYSIDYFALATYWFCESDAICQPVTMTYLWYHIFRPPTHHTAGQTAARTETKGIFQADSQQESCKVSKSSKSCPGIPKLIQFLNISFFTRKENVAL